MGLQLTAHELAELINLTRQAWGERPSPDQAEIKRKLADSYGAAIRPASPGASRDIVSLYRYRKSEPSA